MQTQASIKAGGEGLAHSDGFEWLARAGGDLEAYLNWAAWLRGHAADPRWRAHVIRDAETGGELLWGRMDGWRPGDPRWRVRVIDTSSLPAKRVAERLVAWIEAERALVRSGRHPLPGSALDPTG